MPTWRQVRRPVATWTIGYRNHCRPASENIAALEKPATIGPKTVREMLTQQPRQHGVPQLPQPHRPDWLRPRKLRSYRRWRDQDAVKPNDNRRELPDGTVLASRTEILKAA